MCKISNKKSRRKSGYKVMAWDGKNFYSIFTGQKIKVGKVPMPPRKVCKPLAEGWDRSIYRNPIKNGCFYVPEYRGKTAAFCNIGDAKHLAKHHLILDEYQNEFQSVVVKIKFEGDCYEGKYGAFEPVIAGSNIASIEILKKYSMHTFYDTK